MSDTAQQSEWRRGGPGLKPIDHVGVWERLGYPHTRFHVESLEPGTHPDVFKAGIRATSLSPIEELNSWDEALWRFIGPLPGEPEPREPEVLTRPDRPGIWSARFWDGDGRITEWAVEEVAEEGEMFGHVVGVSVRRPLVTDGRVGWRFKGPLGPSEARGKPEPREDGWERSENCMACGKATDSDGYCGRCKVTTTKPVSADGKKGDREAKPRPDCEGWWFVHRREGRGWWTGFRIIREGRDLIADRHGQQPIANYLKAGDEWYGPLPDPLAADTSAALAEARKEIESLKGQMDEAVGQTITEKREVDRLRDVVDGVYRVLEAAGHSPQAPIARCVHNLIADRNSLATERDALRSRLTAAEAKVEELTKERDEARGTVNANAATIHRLKGDLARLSVPSADGDAKTESDAGADHEDYETAGGYVLGEFTKFLNKHGEKRAKRLASLVQMLPRLKAALMRESRP